MPSEINVQGGDPLFPQFPSGSTRSFGSSVQVGDSPVMRPFWIENFGDTDLVVSSITLPTGFEFADSTEMDESGGSISPSDRAIVRVEMQTDNAAVYSDDMVINNNDADEGTYIITLSGTVLSPLADDELQTIGNGTEERQGRTTVMTGRRRWQQLTNNQRQQTVTTSLAEKYLDRFDDINYYKQPTDVGVEGDDYPTYYGVNWAVQNTALSAPSGVGDFYVGLVLTNNGNSVGTPSGWSLQHSVSVNNSRIFVFNRTDQSDIDFAPSVSGDNLLAYFKFSDYSLSVDDNESLLTPSSVFGTWAWEIRVANGTLGLLQSAIGDMQALFSNEGGWANGIAIKAVQRPADTEIQWLTKSAVANGCAMTIGVINPLLL